MTDYERVLKTLGERSPRSNSLLDILNSELSLPNIPMPTMGGEVFWNDIAEYNGWRLQQNMITHHARILDSGDVRIAWGTVNGMKAAMNRMVSALHQYEPSEEDSSKKRLHAMQELKSLKELLDIGAISQPEYDSRKEKLMKQI